MLSEPILREAIEAAGLDAPIRFEERTRSTQDLAWSWAEDGAPEWSTVGAGHQTEGRGREGRTWLDDAGASLLVSIVLRPPVGASLGLLPLAAGAAAAAASTAAADRDVRCSWPNDLLLDGGKVGGLLAQSGMTSDGLVVVLGIGINLSRAPREVDVPTSSLGDVDAGALLAALLVHLRERYPQLDAREVLDDYAPRCETLGRRVRARVPEGSVEGVAVDLDDDGALVVEVDRRRVRVTSGEVERLTVVGEPGRG